MHSLVHVYAQTVIQQFGACIQIAV